MNHPLQEFQFLCQSHNNNFKLCPRDEMKSPPHIYLYGFKPEIDYAGASLRLTIENSSSFSSLSLFQKDVKNTQLYFYSCGFE